MGKMQFDQFLMDIKEKNIDLYGLTVKQNNSLIGEIYLKNKLRKEIRSCSKSITSLGVGKAVDEGLFSLDDKIADYFPEFLPDDPQPELLSVTIKNLLTMTMGYNRYILSPFVRDSYKGDWLEYIFSEKLDSKPGTRFVYNNACPYLCGALISKLTGRNYLEWMKEKFFEPLHINNPQWFSCPKGRPVALGGLFLSVDELSRFGQLVLDGGIWEGKRLISEDYLREATRKQMDVETSVDDVNIRPNGDFAAGYGYFFWINEKEGSRMWGRYGQNCIILPKRKAVITCEALEEHDEQGLLDCIWKDIVPQLD